MVKSTKRTPPLMSQKAYLARLQRSAITAFTLIGGSLLLGVLGYHWIAGLGWTDSILNASMILTGMGPVDRMESRASKLFASAYALFSGVAFLTSVGLLIAPMAHRWMHQFHLESEEDAERD